MAATQQLPLHGTGDFRLAIIVSPDLTPGFMANTVATIAVGLGAVHHGLGNVRLTDSDGLSILNSADRPVPILQARNDELLALLEKAQSDEPDITLVAFPAYARSLHSFDEYETAFPKRSLRTEQLDGIGICGPFKRVRSLTGSLKLLR